MTISQQNKKALIGAIASCLVCEKEWSNYLTAQRQAVNHARKTGHKVHAELTYYVEYLGKKP